MKALIIASLESLINEGILADIAPTLVGKTVTIEKPNALGVAVNHEGLTRCILAPEQVQILG